MNLRTKLEGKEGQWIRVHFMDTSYFNGVLRQIGADYVEIESYNQDSPQLMGLNNMQQPTAGPENMDSAHSAKHLIPLHLIKFITTETNTFMDSEKKRLEYIAENANLSDSCNIPEIER